MLSLTVYVTGGRKPAFFAAASVAICTIGCAVKVSGSCGMKRAPVVFTKIYPPTIPCSVIPSIIESILT